ncbi:MAG: thioredoxin domain-containing protein [Acidimicrobiales bacterium]
MNRLADETSPYLRQHRDNPVDWYPWGEEAFARARAEDRPVLLSVGYSACHWCHVMAHESFEDDEVAAAMNGGFVCVKVDREERPDVDAVYMEAVQAMTGQGGWPMTVFLTPDGRPFYGGTYYPKRRGLGRPGFLDLLAGIADAWTGRREELLGAADHLAQTIQARASLPVDQGQDGPAPGPDLVAAGVAGLQAGFDRNWGGFGRAPKFPMPANLELLLGAFARRGDPEILDMVVTTLDAMASGGIYDHLGGGFARYSVDTFWMVPHFEKMLYDQAGLARAYLHAWQVTGQPRFRQVVEETVGYVLRDLSSAEGGRYSAEDADSEGEEGRFYVWSADEVAETGGPDAVAWYGITRSGNFEGANILHRPVRGDLVRPPLVEAARARLFAVREGRVRPGLDDKVLTEWNAMFVSTLAEAAAALGRADWLAAAVRTAELLLGELRREDGRWLRSWQPPSADHPGGARHLAYAVDHAWLIDAFTRLAEATGQGRWIAEAVATADALVGLFADGEAGGFFTTGGDAERLIVRQKDLFDGATPSANSVAAGALLRLSALTGDRRYGERAEAVIELVAPTAGRHPGAFSHLLGALDLALGGITEVVVVGDRRDLVEPLSAGFRPDTVVAWGEPYPSPLWDGRQDGLAYVCRHHACQAPVSTPEDLLAQLAPLAPLAPHRTV